MASAMNAPNRILVTGGAGFIGSATVKALLDANKEVLVLDNLFSGKMDNLDLSNPNLEFVEGDILEYPLVYDLLMQCDSVIHLAAIASVPYSIENPIYSFQVNVQGFLHVLHAAHESGKNIPIVYASSAAVYGAAQQLPCDDEIRLTSTPLSPYALQKIQNEQYADLYQRLFGVQSLGLRYFNVYGRGQDPQSSYAGVISHFLKAYQEGEELVVYGDGEQSRDFIYISDVAKANLLALNAGSPAGGNPGMLKAGAQEDAKPQQGIINIATGEPSSLLRLIKTIERQGGKPAQIKFLPERRGDIKASYGTTKLAQELINFKSQVSLEEGIASMTVSTNPLS